MIKRPAPATGTPKDTLSRALEDLAWIRRRADDRCEHAIRTVAQAYDDLPDPERDRIIAKACLPHRKVEAALTRRLAARLDAATRRRVFDRTLDPYFLPGA
jgi:hypothetical protein